MNTAFSFDRALTYPFKAPHFKSFPWMFGLSYAAILVVLFLVIGLLSWQGIAEWFLAMQQIENDPNPAPDEVFALMFGGLGGLLPVLGVASLLGWVIWAMFEVASQKRYLFGEKFSLGFGGDELRMMVVGLLWSVMSIAVFLIPGILLFTAISVIMGSDLSAPMDDQTAGRFMAYFFGGFGLMFLFFFLYVFIATRLAPCFALTVKEREIRFFDAWNVSRGRFWPILGAYVIIAIVVSIVSQMVSMLAQLVMMPILMTLPEQGDVPTEALAGIFLSPGFIIPMALIYFMILFVQGLTQHFVAAPASLAARHDPRNDPSEAERVDVFS
ncbi:putative membrane protein [Hyphomonas neptunium ATCC 15444]|uniref:Glycerophosphoryl diester phosphodiesterase membrane domain-containing protein n=2 Tax=Hyphomonas TaxID=85 RepID=A0A059F978_9PROT|nr:MULTISPECIES: hypothetical protein [Hyphomonas]ABI77808.1 putative membrane protein [Hyphomonas neptunium ATCC 15444]KCZ87083.1 hypothetical protein HHI_16407 [Hyphomonas hirschiana VP5]